MTNVLGYADGKFADVVADLLEDYVNQFGVDVVYLRKHVAGVDHVLNEEIQIEYGHGAAMRIAFTDVPVEIDSPVIDKFGLDYQFGNYYKASLPKRSFRQLFANEDGTPAQPEAGDLLYVKGARIFLEVVEVSDDPNMFADAGRFAAFQIKLHPWRNNMDIFTEELITAFDTWEGLNDLIFWRRENDLMGIRFPDQDGDRSCIDELNQPVPDDAPQVTVTPDDLKSDADELGDAMDDLLEKRDPYAKNKTLRDEEDLGWN